MASVDLDKYKKAWENEKSFKSSNLSANEISAFLKSSSKSLNELYRKGIYVDLVLKLILFVAIIVFLFQVSYSFYTIVSFCVVLFDVAGMVCQIKILGKLPYYENVNQNVVEKLRSYTWYYYNYYIRSIYIGALSGALFFIIGSMYYFRLKYQEIPQFQIDDIIVLGTGILLSYGFNAFIQLKYNNFRIKQLVVCLSELEDNALNEKSIRKYYNFRQKSFIVFGILLIAGLILLLIILMTINF